MVLQEIIQIIVDFKENMTKVGKKLDKNLKNIAFRSKKVDVATGRMTTTFRGFRMEMLSVMFFGMQMQKMFMGLLGPALETSGVFDLLSSTLEILFLPIILAILPVIEKITNWFMNLPEPAKLVIGSLVLLGAALGTVMFLGGQFVLFLGGFITIFGSTGAAIGIMTGTLVPLAIAIVGVITAITLLYFVWKSNWLGIRDIFANVSGWVIDRMNALRDAVASIISGIISGIDTLISAFNRIPILPNIPTIGGAAAGGGNVSVNTNVNAPVTVSGMSNLRDMMFGLARELASNVREDLRSAGVLR